MKHIPVLKLHLGSGLSLTKCLRQYVGLHQSDDGGDGDEDLFNNDDDDDNNYL